MRTISFLILTACLSGAQTFEVIREKPLWFDQQGTLRIDESRICFTAKGEDEPRCWDYVDIQHLDRVSPTELGVLTYEDVAWKLGRDRLYRFELTGGELSDALFAEMTARLGRPATNRVIPPKPPPEATAVPAKHLKTFGGSEGKLYLSPERIVYRTDAEEQSREWRLSSEVASVWSSDPYRLEVHVYEGAPGAFRQPKAYQFALKRPLDRETYRRLKMRLLEIDRARSPAP